ncbi:MmcB family DNA repair protein [Xanthobacter pseudotagetidis]|uniref:MmcB family DNA repair protein n=1 Tax=Xanthobacter pseudotagetidis TaxID=3119911 RepID=UPI00372A03EF
MRPDTLPEPPEDGRQSPTARAVQRGVLRHLSARGLVGIPEFCLVSGRRADILAVDGRGEVSIVEIKSSVQDFRTDLKWPEYRAYCDRLLFAVPLDFPAEILPLETGLLVADAFGAELLRPAPAHPLPAATRKALMLRFAHTAASRLAALHDPELTRYSL